MRGAQDAVRLASSWLTDSGIQLDGKNKKHSGGVAAWYETETGAYPFLYSEITGYAISAYLFWNSVRRDPKALRCAKAAARWLMGQATRAEGGVKTRLYLDRRRESPQYGFGRGRVYAFDTAMVGYGLLQLYRKDRDSNVLAFAGGLLRFLLDHMRRAEGAYWPYHDPEKPHYGEDPNKWSDQSGSFHAKLALFLIESYRLTGERRSKAAAEALLDRTISLQRPTGRFVTERADQSTHLHPHGYTLEGLIYGWFRLGDERCLRAAWKGFEWMLSAVSEDGAVAHRFADGRFTRHERSDVVAQTLRIGSLLFAADPKRGAAHLAMLEKIRRHLTLYQYLGGGQTGGFIYGAAEDGLVRFHLNAWATMFAMQALWMHERFVHRRRPLRLDPFV